MKCLPHFLAAFILCGTAWAQHAVTVEKDSSGQWKLLRDGKPYRILGVCGAAKLEALKELGANSIRTYRVDQLEKPDDAGKNLLDHAHELGLTVALGIGVKPVRWGFDVNDPAQVAAEREKVLAAVRKYKDHPAILMWSLGNEVELQRPPEELPKIFAVMNEFAKLVKQEDPNHPVMTVVAGPNEKKLAAIIENYPEIDILGMNAYGDAPSVPKKLAAAGWAKPYVLSEFGPRGHWEGKKTAWEAPVEPSTPAKAALYQKAYEANVNGFREQCLGSYAFLWGNKQEVTSTWMGMLLTTGEKTPAVDAISYCWTGKHPANRAPVTEKIDAAAFGQKTIAAGSEYPVKIEAKDADHDPLSAEGWVMKESTKTKVGGDKEAVPETIPGCVSPGKDSTSLVFKAPAQAGNYRLFIKVSDGKGGASVDNIPFQVQ